MLHALARCARKKRAKVLLFFDMTKYFRKKIHFCVIFSSFWHTRFQFGTVFA